MVGLGYVGLEVANSFAEESFMVLGIDSDSSKVEMICLGQSPVENVSNTRLCQNLNSKNLSVTKEFSGISECDVVIYCVPTPLDSLHQPDLSFLVRALHSSARYFSEHTLIVNESTSFPGTLRNLLTNQIAKINPKIMDKLEFAVAPERVSPGNSIPLKEITRVVSGLTPNSKRRVKELYNAICNDVRVVETPEIAEMSKLLENTFRQVNISFINEFNFICRRMGIDTRKVIEAANSKPFGFMKFNPGPGIGGHCIPVDPLYLQDSARKIGIASSFIEIASQYNKIHAGNLVSLVEEEFPTRKLQSALILGVAYKSGLGDVRESSAEQLVEALNARGIRTGWFDPLVASWRGTEPSIPSDMWDIAIVHTAQPNMPLEALLASGTKIFDLTGEYVFNEKIIQL